MISVCTSATGNQLTTVDALKALLFGATATSTAQDSLLESSIDRASSLVQEFLGYPVARQVYSETVPAFGDNQLMLSRTPVVAVESLTDSEDNLIDSTGYALEEPDAGILRRDEGFPWTVGVQFELDPRPVPGSEKREYVCVYEAGYTLSCSTSTDGWVSNTTGRTLPSWLEYAALETAKSVYKRRSADGSVQSKRIGDLSITYGNVDGSFGSELPASAAAALRSHARSV